MNGTNSTSRMDRIESTRITERTNAPLRTERTDSKPSMDETQSMPTRDGIQPKTRTDQPSPFVVGSKTLVGASYRLPQGKNFRSRWRHVQIESRFEDSHNLTYQDMNPPRKARIVEGDVVDPYQIRIGTPERRPSPSEDVVRNRLAIRPSSEPQNKPFQAFHSETFFRNPETVSAVHKRAMPVAVLNSFNAPDASFPSQTTFGDFSHISFSPPYSVEHRNAFHHPFGEFSSIITSPFHPFVPCPAFAPNLLPSPSRKRKPDTISNLLRNVADLIDETNAPQHSPFRLPRP